MAPERRFDVLIVGAGPAGLAAASTASLARKSVGLVDDNFAPGGQIWRGEAAKAHSESAAGRWLEAAKHAGVDFIGGARVIGRTGPDELLAESTGGCLVLKYDTLVLASGARELFLPFPGWTLPNAMGAGGLQALAKSGLSVTGKSVVVAGSGPLLLAVAAYLRSKGVVIRLIAEQAPRARVVRFGLGLAGSPGKLAQAFRLKSGLLGVRQVYGCWPSEAHGADQVVAVTLTNGRTSWREPCDFLACGFGLVPNTELPRLLGCAIGARGTDVDALQQTSVPNIYCVGEATGIGGLDKSLLEGRIAGHAAVGDGAAASRLFAARDKALAFAASLDAAFTLRDELRHLARPETIVCRCEDVTLGQLLPYGSSRAAKLHTRCGMGPCQGRICGPATQFIRGWESDSVRPPVFPARLGSLTHP